MKPYIRYALLFGAVVVAGGGVALATIKRSPAPVSTASAVSPAQAYTGRTAQGRSSGGRFFQQFDLDHDGRVTREEFGRALAQQFAQGAGAGQTMTEEQFIASRLKDLRQHTDQMFHRDDWNGDGKLSLDEYLTPERVRFQYADNDGTGVIECSGRSRSDTSRGTDGSYSQRSPSYGGSSRGSGGRGAFCKSDDLDHDGRVTRAEFDSATAKEFAAFAKGGSLTADSFYAIVAAHMRDSAAHLFARLDKNYDGKLDRDEFTSSELRYFARMDRNSDGVVTRDEIGSGRRYGATGDGKPGRT